MPPPFYTLTAAERAKISIPDRFKCRQCEQFKIPAEFSNKEIKDYQYKKSCIPGTTGVTAKLRCRPCAGAQLLVLKCEGPCGVTKPLDSFSKSQRRGGLKWCQECVLWKEAAEPGTVLEPPPGTELAVPEASESDGWSYNSDPEGDSDSDEGTGTVFPFLPYPGMEEGVEEGIKSLKIAGEQGGQLSSIAGPQGSSIVGPIATQQMARLQNKPASASNRGSSSTITAPQSGYVPPHLRAVSGEPSAPSSQVQPAVEKLIDIEEDNKTVSSASNPYEDAWSSTGILGPWSVVDNRRRTTLFEPQRSLGERTPSGSGVGHRSVPQPSTRNNWAKPVGTRRQPPQFPKPVPAPPRRRRRQGGGYDSDGSQDEM